MPQVPQVLLVGAFLAQVAAAAEAVLVQFHLTQVLWEEMALLRAQPKYLEVLAVVVVAV
jgi:hypothetical protein